MKRSCKILFMIVIFFILILSYNGKNANCNNNIVIGKGVNNLNLKDNLKKVINEIGNPEFVWINEAWVKEKEYTNLLDFTNKYLISDVSQEINNSLEYARLFGYSNNNKKFAVFDQPLFKQCFIYYSKGLCIYFNERDEIVQFIIITEELSFKQNTKNKFEHFSGLIKELNIRTEDLYKKIRSKFAYFFIFNLYIEDKDFYPEYYNSVNIYDKNTYFIYSKRTQRLLYLSIIDKSIGGIKATELLWY